MMGSTDDPEDGAAVAGTVFATVGVYAVSPVLCTVMAKRKGQAPNQMGVAG